MTSDVRRLQDDLLLRVQTEIGIVQAMAAMTPPAESAVIEKWVNSLESLNAYIQQRFTQLQRETTPIQHDIRREPNGDILWA